MRFVLLSLSVLVLLIACKNSAKVGTKIPLTGGELTFLGVGNGEPIKAGDWAWVYISVMNDAGGKEFDSRETSGEPTPIQVPLGVDTMKSGITPVILGLSKLSVGDSCKINILMTEDEKKIKEANPAYKGPSAYTYYLHVVKKSTQEEYEKDIQQKQKVFEEAEKKITADIVKKIEDAKAGKYPKSITTPGGVKVVMIEEGTGEKAEQGKMITANYYGCLSSTGKKFDSSFTRGKPLQMPLMEGALITGWIEGFSALKTGGKAIFFIPSKMGYGERAMGEEIPANSDLTFYVELLKVEDFKQ